MITKSKFYINKIVVIFKHYDKFCGETRYKTTTDDDEKVITSGEIK